MSSTITGLTDADIVTTGLEGASPRLSADPDTADADGTDTADAPGTDTDGADTDGADADGTDATDS